MSDALAQRSFNQFLSEVEDGELHGDLSKQLRDIVAALHDARAEGNSAPKAKLTITFDFELDTDVIEIRGDMKVVVPKKKRGRSIFWATPENNLTRQNPRQHTLPLRDVSSGPSVEIRSAT